MHLGQLLIETMSSKIPQSGITAGYRLRSSQVERLVPNLDHETMSCN